MFYTKKEGGDALKIGREEIRAGYEADIVVVGGGHAGTQCALAAAEQGASVLVLESKPRDGMRWVGEQIGAVNSRYHIAHGFGPYNTDDIVDELYQRSSYLANPVLLKKYVENSGEMIDNMIALLPEDSTLLDDDQFNIHQPFGTHSYPICVAGTRSWAATMSFRGSVVEKRDEGPDFKFPRRSTNYAINQLSRLSEFEMLALKRSQELGADWHFGATAVALCRREDGRITGVTAKTKDGYIECTARKGVVLSGGTFNRSALELGLSVGAYSCHDLQLHFIFDRVKNGMGGGPFLTLNRRGERFMDESNFYASAFAIDRQPDGFVCTVMDANYMDQITRSGLQHGTPDFGRPEYLRQFQEDLSHVTDAGAEGYLVRDMSTSEREMARYYGAWTLEELAGYLGYTCEDAARFLASIRRYNEMCRAGRDTDFNKEPAALLPINTPPFYASKSHVEHKIRDGSDTPVGLMTDNDFNVLDMSNTPIPGLYAAGNCMGGKYGPYYCTPFGGVHIGSAMTHGRVLGKQLAALPAD